MQKCSKVLLLTTGQKGNFKVLLNRSSILALGLSSTVSKKACLQLLSVPQVRLGGKFQNIINSMGLNGKIFYGQGRGSRGKPAYQLNRITFLRFNMK